MPPALYGRTLPSASNTHTGISQLADIHSERKLETVERSLSPLYFGRVYLCVQTCTVIREREVVRVDVARAWMWCQ